MRAIILLICAVFGLSTTSAQQREKYEFMRNLPVYADSLIADLDYPLAWGNSDIKDFNAWKAAARQKVFDCMLTPPPAPEHGYEAKILFEEQRDGYKARKIMARGHFPLSICFTTTAVISLSARRSVSIR